MRAAWREAPERSGRREREREVREGEEERRWWRWVEGWGRPRLCR